MFIFDTLSFLETYMSVIPNMLSVIDLMDHSIPYESEDGLYTKDNIKYVVETTLTSKDGFPVLEDNGGGLLEVVLDGKEILADKENVFILEEGRFLYHKNENGLRKALSLDIPRPFKSVTFIL